MPTSWFEMKDRWQQPFCIAWHVEQVINLLSSWPCFDFEAQQYDLLIECVYFALSWFRRICFRIGEMESRFVTVALCKTRRRLFSGALKFKYLQYMKQVWKVCQKSCLVNKKKTFKMLLSMGWWKFTESDIVFSEAHKRDWYCFG